MFGFMNINMRNFQRNNTAIIHNAVDKMNNGYLEVNDILDSEELTTDIKSSMSQLANFFNEGKNIKSLLDYIIKEPTVDEQKRGHKYPFYACEILCSENPNILKNIFNEHRLDELDYEDYDNDKSRKKSSYDDGMDLDIDDQFNREEDNHLIEPNEDDIVTNDNKFKISDEEEYKEVNKNNQEDDDLVNIDDNEDKDPKKSETLKVSSSPFDKKEETNENNRYNDDETTETKEYSVLKEQSVEKKDNEELFTHESKKEDTETNNKTEKASEERHSIEKLKELQDKQPVQEVVDVKEFSKTQTEEVLNSMTQNSTEHEKLEEEFNKLVQEEKEKKSREEKEEKKNLIAKQQDHDDHEDHEEHEDLDEKEEKHEEKEEDDKEDEEIEEHINNEYEEKEYDEKQRKEEHKKDIFNLSLEKFESEFLDYFFSFLDTEEPLNFVLSGYFAKVFGHFLNQRQNIIMRYIFITKPEIMKLLTRHINRKSIVECIYKILISYSDDIPNSLDIKINFIKMIIEAFNPDDDEIVTNVCDLILDMFSVRKMYILFITNKNIFKLIFDFVLQNINNDSFKHLIKILIKANENILKDFGNNLVTPTFTCNETQELFFNFTYNVSNLISGNNYSQMDANDDLQINMQNLQQQFQLIFNTLTLATEVILKNFVEQDKNVVNEMETTFGIKVKMLGTKRLLEIEFIRSILEILVNAYANNIFNESLDLSKIIDIIIDSKFFMSALVSYITNYDIFSSLFLYIRITCISTSLIVSIKRNLRISSLFYQTSTLLKS